MSEGKIITDIVAKQINKNDNLAEQENASATITGHAQSSIKSSNGSITNNQSTDQPSDESEPEKTVSKKGISIKPLNNPETTEPKGPNSTESQELPKKTYKNDKSLTISTTYEASDSLPNNIDIKTTEATNNMQSPRIYDTKEYFVPIKDTTHSHGHLGTILAGLVAAAVVMAVVAFAAMNFF